MLQKNQTVHGFTITGITKLDALRCTAIEAFHNKSGARLIHLNIPDEAENLFSVAFRTPPSDDTGVMHILEHSVLGGSSKFPVKDPFLEMLKMSMATFINAMTYPDKTVYPVASTVKNDFFNLVDVYCDAVFHPGITPETLSQEGHHLDFANRGDIESPLTIRGIVYNEMKGAYSDLDSQIERTTSQLLFPDSIYGYDSGGDPEEIPELTYRQFRTTYEKFYHPSNAYFFLCGNIPTEESLEFLDERLADFTSDIQVDSKILAQPKWTKPRFTEIPYSVDTPKEDQCVYVVNWAVGCAAEPFDDLSMDVLDRLLLGNAGAPLRKALMDSGYGKDLTQSGYSSGILEGTFQIGLKGCRKESAEKIENLIRTVLKQCSEDGFSNKQVKTAFQQLEYSHREIQTLYPLRLMEWVYDSWIYDKDPLAFLHTGKVLENIQQAFAKDSEFFCNLIKTKLLNNPHILTSVFYPDAEMQQNKTKAFMDTMADIKSGLTREQLIEIAETARRLEEAQSTPNTPEALATLPQLHISDLPKEPKEIPTIQDSIGDGTFIQNNVFSNGVSYFALAVELDTLDIECWQYLPIFSQIITRVGIGKCSYTETSERIASNTGGISAGCNATTHAQDRDRLIPCFSFRGKALDNSYEEVLHILSGLMDEARFDEKQRILEVLHQMEMRLQSRIVPNGHNIAAQHAGSSFSAPSAVSYIWGAENQLYILRDLLKDTESGYEKLKRIFLKIRTHIASTGKSHFSFTGSEKTSGLSHSWLSERLASATASQPIVDLKSLYPQNSRYDGLAAPVDVTYCACCMDAPHSSDPTSVYLQLFSQIVSFDYLWEEVRAKGGAYGAQSFYDSSSSIFEMLSYRDPHPQNTLQIFAQLKSFAEKRKLSKDDIERAVIACAKGNEKPIRPGSATTVSLWRKLTGVTHELRKERRKLLMTANGKHVRDAACNMISSASDNVSYCVLASRNVLENLDKRFTVKNIL